MIHFILMTVIVYVLFRLFFGSSPGGQDDNPPCPECGCSREGCHFGTCSKVP